MLRYAKCCSFILNAIFPQNWAEYLFDAISKFSFSFSSPFHTIILPPHEITIVVNSTKKLLISTWELFIARCRKFLDKIHKKWGVRKCSQKERKFLPDQLRLVFMVESFSWESFRSEWKDGGAKIWVDELKFFFPDITNPTERACVCVCERKEWTFLH